MEVKSEVNFVCHTHSYSSERDRADSIILVKLTRYFTRLKYIA